MDILNENEQKIALENGFDENGLTPIHRHTKLDDLLNMRVQQMALFVDATVFVKVKEHDADFIHAQYISIVQWKNQLKSKINSEKIKDIPTSQIGNIAYLSLHDPTVERRQKWKDILEDMIGIFTQITPIKHQSEDTMEFCTIM